MEVKQIQFRFKGTRNYVHGTDMFNAMTSSCPSSSMNNLRFTIHDIVQTPLCQLYWTDRKDELGDIADIRVRCQFVINGSTQWLVLTQGEGEITSGARYDFDEEKIISRCLMEAGAIRLVQKSQYTFIENIVAMNKHMHQQLFPEADGKWMFTRIDLDVLCDEQENLALEFKHNMNFRLTKSDVLVSGNKVGDIYFSLVKS
jgi:hypothetical protein